MLLSISRVQSDVEEILCKGGWKAKQPRETVGILRCIFLKCVGLKKDTDAGSGRTPASQLLYCTRGICRNSFFQFLKGHDRPAKGFGRHDAFFRPGLGFQGDTCDSSEL